MKISVSSSLHGQTGNSTVALFLSHALALSQSHKICLTHADFGNRTILNTLGLEADPDITRSLSHVAKLLKSGMISVDELPEYALKVFPGLDLYSTDKTALDAVELYSFYDFLLNKMTAYNHIIIDVDAGIKADISRLAIAISDVLIIPVTHNIAVLTESIKFKDNLVEQFQKARRRRDLRIFYFLNHYNPGISSYAKVAKVLGVKSSNLLMMHENMNLVSMSNNGKLSDVFADALKGKYEYADLKSDMKHCCKQLLGNDFKWDIQQRRADV